MKFLLQAIFILIGCAISILAQQKRLPHFEDYAVSENYKGKVASVRLTSSSARMYRTMLRENAKEGVNFAGHYILALGAAALTVILLL